VLDELTLGMGAPGVRQVDWLSTDDDAFHAVLVRKLPGV
jgi:hypothetical protein